MTPDPIIEELHHIREDLLAQFQGDFKAYFAELLRRQAEHPTSYASFARVPVSIDTAQPKSA